jgi:hypothetical protein
VSTIAEHDADLKVMRGSLTPESPINRDDDLAVALELYRLYGGDPTTERSNATCRSSSTPPALAAR